MTLARTEEREGALMAMIKYKRKFKLKLKLRSTGIRMTAFLALISLLFGCFVSCGKKSGKDFEYPLRTVSDDAEEKSFGSYKYTEFNDGTLMLTEYSGNEEYVTVPDTVDGKKVVALARRLFDGKTALKSVKLGKYTEMIGDECFSGCTSLYSVERLDGVWSVGAGAFDGTAWLEAKTDEFVVVGDSVLIKYNGEAAYVEIPDTVKHIGGAFELNTYVTYVVIPDSVYTIGSYAFFGCERLYAVDFGKNVQYIGMYAFNDCGKITSLEFPDSLEYIDACAFSYALALTTVRLGSSVKYIGDSAFYCCTLLSSVYIPRSCVTFEAGAFSECYGLALVFYEGTEEEFNAIGLDYMNYILLDAYKIYNAK